MTDLTPISPWHGVGHMKLYRPIAFVAFTNYIQETPITEVAPESIPEGVLPWSGYEMRRDHPNETARADGWTLNDEEAVKIDVIYGSNDIHKGTTLKAMKMIRHPEFDAAKFLHDIAILLVDNEFAYGNNARPICVPSAPVNIFNSDVVVAGWGFLSQDGKAVDYLRYTVVKVVPNARCADKFQHTGYRKDLMYCAYRLNTDACQGDSGGPMMTRVQDGRYLQVGIVSYGIGCALDDMPGVYARLEALVPWLLKSIGAYESYRDLSMEDIAVPAK
ncbi:transmembrane protease serine 9 [Rhipicephalus sanguineus]|uniref:transmembrane protease serine 9 n=1 Tax=Rhipicephalus sanguineus TaxID=34632 RepID=UPI0020C52E42|nr:transmembrane protease serine 9 [Rhipicephalus sanguineus]